MAFPTGSDFNGVRFTTLVAGNVVGGQFTNGRVHVFVDTYVMTTPVVAKSKNIAMGFLPGGCVPLGGWLNNSASLGTSVVSIGITGNTAKYRALLVKTSLTPELFGATAAMGVQLGDEAEEEVLLVNDATADMPAAGTIVMQMFYATL